MRLVLVGLLGFMAGLTAHAIWGTRSARSGASVPVASAALAQPPQQGAGAVDWDRLRMEVRLVVRDELAHNAARMGSAPKAPEPPPTLEQKQAKAGQEQLLERAIQAGAWTDEDALHFRTLLTQMAPGERFGALSAVNRAINAGQVKLETHSPF